LRPDYCDGFVANLALIARLERAGRSNHQPLIKAIYEFLQSGPCQSGLLEALSSNDRLVRRASFKLALESPEPDQFEVLKAGLSDDDTVIRLMTARAVVSSLEGRETPDELLERMKRDRLMGVRREAVRVSARLRQERATSELTNALLDSRSSVRMEARY